MKSTLTIDREYFENEEGIACVKRVIKEDGVLIYEDSIKVSRLETSDTKLNMFERWIDGVKNPDKVVGRSGTYVYKRGKLKRVDDPKSSKYSGN